MIIEIIMTIFIMIIFGSGQTVRVKVYYLDVSFCVVSRSGRERTKTSEIRTDWWIWWSPLFSPTNKKYLPRTTILLQFFWTWLVLIYETVHIILREGWRFQNGWIFGKVPKKRGGGYFTKAKKRQKKDIQNFHSSLQWGVTFAFRILTFVFLYLVFTLNNKNLYL